MGYGAALGVTVRGPGARRQGCAPARAGAGLSLRTAPAHATRVAPAKGIWSIGAMRTGALGFGAWIILPLPM